jgi:hypothetical protein
MTQLKLIKGGRRELEFKLLTALFTPGGNAAADTLRKQLTPRAKGRIRAVGPTPASPPSEPSPLSESVKDRT